MADKLPTSALSPFPIVKECCSPGCTNVFNRLLDQDFMIHCPKHRTPFERENGEKRLGRTLTGRPRVLGTAVQREMKPRRSPPKPRKAGIKADTARKRERRQDPKYRELERKLDRERKRRKKAA